MFMKRLAYIVMKLKHTTCQKMLLRSDALEVNDFFSIMILESNPTDYFIFLSQNVT